MANFKINVNSTSFYVVLNSKITTECANIYEFEVFSTNGNTIKVTFNGDSVTNKQIINNGVTSSFLPPYTSFFNTSMIIKFSLENSGVAGYFSNSEIVFEDVTTTSSYNKASFNIVRENDTSKCIPEIERKTITFNPTTQDTVNESGNFDMTFPYSVLFVSINGQVLNPSEYKVNGTIITITPLNGFFSITDEIIIFI